MAVEVSNYIKPYLQELMDKYDNDHDGRLSLDEYLGELSLIYLPFSTE